MWGICRAFFSGTYTLGHAADAYLDLIAPSLPWDGLPEALMQA